MGSQGKGKRSKLVRFVDFLSVTIPRFVSLWISGFLGHLRSLRRPCYPLGQPHVPYTGFLCKQKAAEIYRVDLNMTRLQIRFDPPPSRLGGHQRSFHIHHTPCMAWVGLKTQNCPLCRQISQKLFPERAHSFADHFGDVSFCDAQWRCIA